jgi:hypothetical protein
MRLVKGCFETFLEIDDACCVAETNYFSGCIRAFGYLDALVSEFLRP